MDDSLNYWLTSSQDDLDTAQKLFDAGKYHHALFFVHLAIEKILKALYVKSNTSAPPPIHDLVRLAEKNTGILTNEEKGHLAEISTFNIAARYDDYKLKFYQKATRNYATKWLEIGKTIYHHYLKQV